MGKNSQSKYSTQTYDSVTFSAAPLLKPVLTVPLHKQIISGIKHALKQPQKQIFYYSRQKGQTCSEVCLKLTVFGISHSLIHAPFYQTLSTEAFHLVSGSTEAFPIWLAKSTSKSRSITNASFSQTVGLPRTG